MALNRLWSFASAPGLLALFWTGLRSWYTCRSSSLCLCLPRIAWGRTYRFCWTIPVARGRGCWSWDRTQIYPCFPWGSWTCRGAGNMCPFRHGRYGTLSAAWSWSWSHWFLLGTTQTACSKYASCRKIGEGWYTRVRLKVEHLVSSRSWTTCTWNTRWLSSLGAGSGGPQNWCSRSHWSCCSSARTWSWAAHRSYCRSYTR